MDSKGTQGKAGQGQGASGEFFGMMTELPTQLSQMSDRSKIMKVAGAIDQICSTMFQKFGISPGQIRASDHRSRWEQIPHLSEQTAARADQLTELSHQPTMYVHDKDQGQMDQTFRDATTQLGGSLREAGISGKATSSRTGAQSGAHSGAQSGSQSKSSHNA